MEFKFFWSGFGARRAGFDAFQAMTGVHGKLFSTSDPVQVLKQHLVRNDIPQDFLTVSQQLGANRHYIQGAGGNTPFKVDSNLIWVKASGKWLMHAEREPVFVAVDPIAVNANITAGMDDPTAGTILPLGPQSLRPSIETTLHSLMPHRVVFHTHSVNTIVNAICDDPVAVLTPKLKGLNWGLVPYSRPGLSLTRLVAALLAEQMRDVLAIQNHGLVVGGDSPAAATVLMQEVEARLQADATPLVAPDRDQLLSACADTDFRVADDDLVHQLAYHSGGFDVVCAESIYPDYIVFLGSAIAGVQSPAGLTAFRQARSDDPLRPRAVALKNVGVVHSYDLSAGGLEMLKALAEVCRRTDPSSKIHYLSRAEEELVSWDAEKYRQTL